MSEEEESVVSEQTEEAVEQQEEQKMVPLAALEAERRKRHEAEGKAQLYQEHLMRASEKKEPVAEEDPDALMEKGYYQNDKQLTKREILEQVYQDMNPKAVEEINKHLKQILEKKPWLAESIDSALNRYSRAYEIVEDYKHLVTGASKSTSSDAQRMVQNSQKPRSPVEIGKSAQPGSKEYLKSIQGKAEFREYRKKVLNGEI